eukprot:37845-Chlamydomonas_euryale.AAC.2
MPSPWRASTCQCAHARRRIGPAAMAAPGDSRQLQVTPGDRLCGGAALMESAPVSWHRGLPARPCWRPPTSVSSRVGLWSRHLAAAQVNGCIGWRLRPLTHRSRRPSVGVCVSGHPRRLAPRSWHPSVSGSVVALHMGCERRPPLFVHALRSNLVAAAALVQQGG